ncbi:matrixin family metalloprotease [Vampirovibrio sp.]|uniref:matrixin family metalloprotease n=1 Tax=Vampirovibrio sp. TaxID=2717857 RepID=UPI0035942E4A
MKIPDKQPRPSAGARIPAARSDQKGLSLDSFKLETVRQSVEKNPLAALSALGQWRSSESKTEGQAVRWSLAQMPLKIWLAPSGEAAMPSERLLFATLRQWEVASEGQIRFRLMDPATEQSEDGDIVFQWSRETVKGRDYEVGHANRELQGQRIRKAHITLILEPVIDGHLTPEKRRDRLMATVLHEVGHALGLEHSEHSKDVMYYRGWQQTVLSPQDAQRLMALYRDAQQSA